MTKGTPGERIAGGSSLWAPRLRISSMPKTKPGAQDLPKLLQLDSTKMAAQIRAARAILNWSQTELGRQIGLSQRSVHRLEQGASDIRRSTALAIEKAFSQAGIEFEDMPDGGFKIAISAPALKKGAT